MKIEMNGSYSMHEVQKKNVQKTLVETHYEKRLFDRDVDGRIILI
jgi:hypothetical protein